MAVAVLVLVGAAVRLTFMDEPMRYDEAFTLYTYVMTPVTHIAGTYDLPNNHVLYSLLTHYVWRVFGDQIWVVRLPAFVAGVALIPAVYLAGRALYGRGAGLLAAAMTVGLAPLVEFSANGRGYTLGILLVVLSLWVAARLLERPTRGDWIALAVLPALAFYAVPPMAFGAATVWLWLGGCALLRGQRATLVRLAVATGAAALLALLLYSPVLGQPAWSIVPRVPVALAPLRDLADQVWRSWTAAAPHPLDWLLGLAFLAGLVFHRRIARQPLPIGAAAVAVVLFAIAVDEVSPFRRSWLYLLPLVAIQASGAIAHAARALAPRVQRPALAGAAAVVVVGAALGAVKVARGLEGTELPPVGDNDLVALLRKLGGPSEPVLVEPRHLAPAAEYYFRQANYLPPVLPPTRRRLRALIVVPHGAFKDTNYNPAELGRPLSIGHAVSEVGWAIRPGTRPRLIVRRRFLSIYEAEIE